MTTLTWKKGTNFVPAALQTSIEQPDHNMGQPDHNMGQPEHYMGQPEHYMGQPEHYMGQPEHYMGQLEHNMGQPEHYMGQPKHYMGQPEHYMGQPEHYMDHYMGQDKKKHLSSMSVMGPPKPSMSMMGPPKPSMSVMGPPSLPPVLHTPVAQKIPGESKKTEWDPVILRENVFIPNWSIHPPESPFQTSQQKVPNCEHLVSTEVALGMIKFEQVPQSIFDIKDPVQNQSLRKFVNEIYKQSSFKLFHGNTFQTVAQIDVGTTVDDLLYLARVAAYTPIDFFIAVDRRKNPGYVRVHIDWICFMDEPGHDSLNSPDIFRFKVTYYVNSVLGAQWDTSPDPIMYNTLSDVYDKIPIPELKEILEQADDLLQDIAFHSTIYLAEATQSELEVNLQEIIGRDICPLVIWGGDGIMVAADSAYRTTVSNRIPIILKHMVHGIRKTLDLYIKFDKLEFFICIRVEFVRENTRDIFKVSYYR